MESDESSKSNLFLDQFADVSAFKDSGCNTVIKLIRSSNDLCRSTDHDYLMSFAPLRNRMDKVAEKVLDQMKLVLKKFNVRRDLGVVSCKEADHEEKLDQLVDVNDILFERISSSLDEASGLKKTVTEVKTLVPSIRNVAATWNRGSGFVYQEDVVATKFKVETSSRQMKSSKFFAANQQTKNLPKPQLKFSDKVNNNSSIPFVPKLRQKPNATTPLPQFFSFLENQKIDANFAEENPEIFSNPYFNEIESFEPDDDLLREVQVQLPKPIETTNFLFVDTIEKLETMMKHLEKQKEFAVDLEHHSFRSYQGFTCLMQISSRTEDFLIDAILLRDNLNILNEVFTNPKIVKVFHGADSDIDWLQKDFGIYVVNMFDTHQAARELNYPALSLAYLLKSFCDIDANKQLQVADWRIRPLPEEFIQYARDDTHYLLYIYDSLRNRLLQICQNDDQMLRNVFQKSKIICQKSYKKPSFDDEAFQTLYQKSKKRFNVRQLAALRSLYYWRDRIARQEDESIGYVLPNHMLLQISETLPRETQSIRACCNPVPLLVQHHIHDIHQIILQVREIPLVEESKEQQSAPLTLPVIYDPESVLNCPHDTSHQFEQNNQSTTGETTKNLSNDLSSLLDMAFIDESKKRLNVQETRKLIEVKTQLEPIKKPTENRIDFWLFDHYMPEDCRISGGPLQKPLWKIFYPSRETNGKSRKIENEAGSRALNQKEKCGTDVEVIMLNENSAVKRKSKGNGEENSSSKAKLKRYRRACVSDEVPSMVILPEIEEAGELLEEEIPSKKFKTFEYRPIDETKILSKKNFKRPADDEQIFEPNRPKNENSFKAKKRPGSEKTNKSLSYPFPKKK